MLEAEVERYSSKRTGYYLSYDLLLFLERKADKYDNRDKNYYHEDHTAHVGGCSLLPELMRALFYVVVCGNDAAIVKVSLSLPSLTIIAMSYPDPLQTN